MTRKLIALGVALLAAGCGGEDEQATNVVEIRGDEYAFVMPKEIEGGWTTMQLTNTGKELHEFGLVRLGGGRTLTDLKRHLSDPASEEQEPPSWMTILAGLATVAPGENAALTQELEPGRYALICFIDGPKGRPHFVDGMISVVEVKGDAGAETLTADAALELGKGLKAPVLEAGEQTLELRNASDEASGLFLVSLKPGKTLEDLGGWVEGGMQGPAVGSLHGGAIDVPPNSSVYLTYTFEPGVEYALFDDVNGIERRFSVR